MIFEHPKEHSLLHEVMRDCAETEIQPLVKAVADCFSHAIVVARFFGLSASTDVTRAIHHPLVPRHLSRLGTALKNKQFSLGFLSENANGFSNHAKICSALAAGHKNYSTIQHHSNHLYGGLRQYHPYALPCQLNGFESLTNSYRS